MRRIIPWTVVITLAATLFLGGGQSCRAADGERVKFETFDKAELRGMFYSSPRGTKGACAILLHPIGGDIGQDGWSELAKRLQKEGFAVLAFDFRGHGASTFVHPDFWSVRTNRELKSYRPGKLKDEISYKDFTSASAYNVLVNDIAAAERFLDQKNDNGECNSSNIVLIGAESGATLGAMWIWYEYNRQRVSVSLPLVTQPTNQVEGQDIVCAVWLSISRSLGSYSPSNVDRWFRNPVRDRVPMFFLYGDGDSKAHKYSQYLYDSVLRAEKEKPNLKLTRIVAVEKANKLSGRELLGTPTLDTMDFIVRYLTKVIEEKGLHTYTKKDVDKRQLLPVPYDR